MLEYEQVLTVLAPVFIGIQGQHLWLALNSILICSKISLPSHFSVSELIRANHIELPKCSGVEFQSGFMVK